METKNVWCPGPRNYHVPSKSHPDPGETPLEVFPTQEGLEGDNLRGQLHHY